MTTHAHFIIGSYAALALAVIAEVYLIRRQRRQALAFATAVAQEAQ